MSIKSKLGTVLAVSAASIFAITPAVSSAHHHHHMVKCVGINGCKGKSKCKTADNSCKGQNSCKGKGFMKTTKAKCEKMGGTVEE